MMGFGFLVARLDLLDGVEQPSPIRLSLWGGLVLVAIGVVVNTIAAIGHARFIDRLNKGLPLRARPVSGGVIVSLALLLIGVGLILYLFSAQ